VAVVAVEAVELGLLVQSVPHFLWPQPRVKLLMMMIHNQMKMRRNLYRLHGCYYLRMLPGLSPGFHF
jgi:hypothetical protein